MRITCHPKKDTESTQKNEAIPHGIMKREMVTFFSNEI